MTVEAEVSELQTEIARLSEQLAEYRSTVAEVVWNLGHVGDDPDALRDAVGQIEALLDGKDSLERNDLNGLAERLRQRLLDAETAVQRSRPSARELAAVLGNVFVLTRTITNEMLEDDPDRAGPVALLRELDRVEAETDKLFERPTKDCTTIRTK